ncbi:MAG: hypothetical protein KF915_20120 [Polyangiaceae bacterium]|nr:hypothetical protein [Polyangiaceae bacterium]
MRRPSPQLVSLLALLVSSGVVSPAWAQAPSVPPVPPSGSASDNEVDESGGPLLAERRADPVEEPIEVDAVATLVAVVPGALVHGLGHYAAGHSTTGGRLLLTQGIGLGVLLGGGAVLVLTGASRDFVGPSAALVIGGAGLFGISYFADIYGVAVPGELRGRASGRAYSTSELGIAYVNDAQFDHRWFLTAGFERWLGPVRLKPTGWFSLGHPNERLRLEVTQRLHGAMPGAPAQDGSSFDLSLAGTRHDFSPERFATTTLEGTVGGRLDLVRLGPTLRGSFAEMAVGWAFTRTGYDVRGLNGAKIPADHSEILLYRMGFGSYLPEGQGELSLYYDHRHDGYAAGFLMGGLGSGVAGHFGFQGRYFPKSRALQDSLGVGLDAQVGSARVLGLSLLFREAM